MASFATGDLQIALHPPVRELLEAVAGPAAFGATQTLAWVLQRAGQLPFPVPGDVADAIGLAFGGALGRNNGATNNLGRLLRLLAVLLARVARSPGADADGDAGCPPELPPLLVLCRILCKQLVEHRLGAEDWPTHLAEAPVAGDPLEASEGARAGWAPLREALSGALLGFAAAGGEFLPEGLALYDAQTEVANLLLVLLSTDVLTPEPRDREGFWVAPLVQHAAAAECVRALAWRFLRADEEADATRPFGVGEVISSMASLPWTALSMMFADDGLPVAEERPPDHTRLAERSLMLLLALTNASALPSGRNRFVQALQAMCDELAAEEAAQGALALPFGQIAAAVGARMVDDRTPLLLYILLQRSPAFFEFVVGSADLGALVVPLLRLLYESEDHHQVYILLIVLLMLSQDGRFHERAHEAMVGEGLEWFVEQRVAPISAGSLAVAVVVRTMQHNLSRLSDDFLHSNCLAFLTNMAPHLADLHPAAAMRLVGMSGLLSRRYFRLQAGGGGGGGGGEAAVADDDAAAALAQLREYLRVLLGVFNAVVAHGLQRNPQLAYAMLRAREELQLLGQQPEFGTAVASLEFALSFLSGRLQDAGVLDDPGEGTEILQAIAAHAAEFVPVRGAQDVHFEYKEVESSPEFFVPYIWAMAMQLCRDIAWDDADVELEGE